MYYDGVSSECKNIVCGVPQGSILGPILFLLYINDIVNVSDKLFPLLYADDTNVFLNGKKLNPPQSRLTHWTITILLEYYIII